jgi:hypothetical protein
MKRVAAGAVRKNLGPDPSMKSKVDLLRRLVALRNDSRKGGGKRPKVDPAFGIRPGGGSFADKPGYAPRKPAQFAGKPGYNFGPPRGM